MVIKIDVDGVIRNILDKMCDIYNRDFGQNIKLDDIKDYDVDVSFPKVREMWGVSAKDYFFRFHSSEVFLLGKAYDCARSSIRRLREHGHKVIIVTWQYTLRNKVDTLYFLSNAKIEYDDICFTRDKWMIHGDWLIDDNPDFIMDDRDTTTRKILVNMPYNKECPFEGKRVNDLCEAVDYIIEEDKK